MKQFQYDSCETPANVILHALLRNPLKKGDLARAHPACLTAHDALAVTALLIQLLPCAFGTAPLGKVILREKPSYSQTISATVPRMPHAPKRRSERLLCRTFCRDRTAPLNHSDSLTLRLCLLPAPHRLVTLELSLLSPPLRHVVLPAQPSSLNIRSFEVSSLAVPFLGLLLGQDFWVSSLAVSTSRITSRISFATSCGTRRSTSTRRWPHLCDVNFTTSKYSRGPLCAS